MAALVLGAAAANGGYFATAWGWIAIPLLWVAGVAVAAGRIHVSRVAGAYLLGLAAVVGATLLALLWTEDVPATVLEIQRTIVYVAAVAAAVLAVRGPVVLLGAILVATTAVSTYSLVTRLFPERLGVLDEFAGARLSEPLGYWNALGIFTAIGALLALAFASRARTIVARAFAAAALPILVATTYFTFGRGPWFALGGGLLAAFILDRRRLQLSLVALVLVFPAGAAVAFASAADGLTRQRVRLAEATADGHRYASIIVLLVVLAAVLAAWLALAERRVQVGRRVRVSYAAALAAVAVAALAGASVRYGAPTTVAERAYDAFRAPPPVLAPGQELSARFFTFSGTWRADTWSAAWEQARGNPWLGSGSGTYEAYWLRHREFGLKVRDAHSLYLETLAEVGVVGLAVLLFALAVPLYAALKARRHPLVAPAAAAYVAFLLHAGIDWDWEVPAVTMTALMVGAAIVGAASDWRSTRALSLHARISLVAVAVALAAFSFIGLVGNRAIAGSRNALETGTVREALREADRARRWAPWSSEALLRLGEAQLAEGRDREARASLRAATEKSPNNWRVWLAYAYATNGRERERAYARAKALNPLEPDVKSFRADLVGEH